MDFKEYTQKITSLDDYPKVIEQARIEYADAMKAAGRDYLGHEIPFNLDKAYFDALLATERFQDAKMRLANIRAVYPQSLENIFEVMEYTLFLLEKNDAMIQKRLNAAEAEFQQRTVLIISIVVGVVAILGAANQAFHLTNFEDMVRTFVTISLTVITLVCAALFVSGLRK